MIKYVVNGNLFDSDCQTLVNTINCEGVMGAGIAKQFKQRFPAMFASYQRQISQWKPGMICRYKLEDGRMILNVATKDKWRNPSHLAWIKRILDRIVSDYRKLGITSIAMTKLGCGLGGLDWDDVGPLMIAALESLPILVEIYIEAGDCQYWQD
jgi:O-acetyl-ADP-ribose deacetylase (regulator of RNase III)